MNAQARAWVEAQKPELAVAAEGYVRDYWEPSGSRGALQRVKPSQLRNLLSAAQAERSLAVLLNFLRYQIGRGNRGWNDSKSGDGLADLLRRQVEERLEKGQAPAGADRYELEGDLSALLLGYVVREHTYRTFLDLERQRGQADTSRGRR